MGPKKTIRSPPEKSQSHLYSISLSPIRKVNPRKGEMEGKASFVALMAVIFAVFSLIGDTHAADAPAPSPTSAAGAVSPSAAAAFVVSFVAFVFGSLFR